MPPSQYICLQAYADQDLYSNAVETILFLSTGAAKINGKLQKVAALTYQGILTRI